MDLLIGLAAAVGVTALMLLLLYIVVRVDAHGAGRAHS